MNEINENNYNPVKKFVRKDRKGATFKNKKITNILKNIIPSSILTSNLLTESYKGEHTDNTIKDEINLNVY